MDGPTQLYTWARLIGLSGMSITRVREHEFGRLAGAHGKLKTDDDG